MIRRRLYAAERLQTFGMIRRKYVWMTETVEAADQEATEAITTNDPAAGARRFFHL